MGFGACVRNIFAGSPIADGRTDGWTARGTGISGEGGHGLIKEGSETFAKSDGVPKRWMTRARRKGEDEEKGSPTTTKVVETEGGDRGERRRLRVRVEDTKERYVRGSGTRGGLGEGGGRAGRTKGRTMTGPRFRDRNMSLARAGQKHGILVQCCLGRCCPNILEKCSYNR